MRRLRPWQALLSTSAAAQMELRNLESVESATQLQLYGRPVVTAPVQQQQQRSLLGTQRLDPHRLQSRTERHWCEGPWRICSIPFERLRTRWRLSTGRVMWLRTTPRIPTVRADPVRAAAEVSSDTLASARTAPRIQEAGSARVFWTPGVRLGACVGMHSLPRICETAFERLRHRPRQFLRPLQRLGRRQHIVFFGVERFRGLEGTPAGVRGAVRLDPATVSLHRSAAPRPRSAAIGRSQPWTSYSWTS